MDFMTIFMGILMAIIYLIGLALIGIAIWAVYVIFWFEDACNAKYKSNKRET